MNTNSVAGIAGGLIRGILAGVGAIAGAQPNNEQIKIVAEPVGKAVAAASSLAGYPIDADAAVQLTGGAIFAAALLWSAVKNRRLTKILDRLSDAVVKE